MAIYLLLDSQSLILMYLGGKERDTKSNEMHRNRHRGSDYPRMPRENVNSMVISSWKRKQEGNIQIMLQAAQLFPLFCCLILVGIPALGWSMRRTNRSDGLSQLCLWHSSPFLMKLSRNSMIYNKSQAMTCKYQCQINYVYKIPLKVLLAKYSVDYSHKK